MSNIKLKRFKTNPEIRKKTEIDAAWERHNTSEYAAQAQTRKKWLEKHLVLQNSICVYCTIPISERSATIAKDRSATIDHIVALSMGGADTFENTVAACLHCNTVKGSLSVDEFKYHPKLIGRIEIALKAPDRLSNDPTSQFYNQSAISRGVVVRLNGKMKGGVCKYSATENWIRVKAGKARNKYGRPVTLKINGTVEAYYKDTALLLAKMKRRHTSP